jgi:hypothetical protein
VAQDRLGFLYYTGDRRLPRDYAEALNWFRKAADRGNPSGQDHLGMMYYLGRGVPRDYTEALKWFRKAAEQGNVHAEREPIEMYDRGLGVPRDYAEAQKWNRKVGERTRRARPSRLPLIFLLMALLLILAMFVWGLVAFQRNTIIGWKRLLTSPFVHIVGVALVLNSINTYAFQFFFPKCTHAFLATSCYEYGNGGAAHFIQALGDFQIINLIFRFMMIIGLGLDVLAIWYAVYVYRLLLLRKAQFHGNPSPEIRVIPQ